MAQQVFQKKNSLILLLPVLACWQVWVWSAQRMQDRSDDPLGLLALVVAIVLAFFTTDKATRRRSLDVPQTVAIVSMLGAYALTSSLLPMLIRAGFAVTAIVLAVSYIAFGKRLHLGIWGLGMLALPVVATMQFYLGFPLRMIITHACSLLLSCAGYAVQQSGTDLVWNHHVVGIDPACSGVKMLWTGLFASFSLACLHRLNSVRTAVLAIATIAIVMLGNMVRATSLFLLDVMKSRLPFAVPEWLHSGIGIVVFAFIVLAVAVIAMLLAKRQDRCSLGSAPMPPIQVAPLEWRSYMTNVMLTIVCIAVAVAPYIVPSTPKIISHSNHQQASLPKVIDGAAVQELPLSSAEQQFSKGFPGQIHKLTDGRRQIIYRVVFEPTRQLHSAEDCFKGLGYKTESLPNFHDREGHSWGRFQATLRTTKRPVRLIVRERIFDGSNDSWADVSAWYWAALLQNARGPWVALTIAEPIEPAI